jgi:hypothetical protein
LWYRVGQFVWCAFPQFEAPVQPGPAHVGYVMAVSGAIGGFSITVAYTTTRPWPPPIPPGVHSFDQAAASAMGQGKAFVLDLRRVARLPVTTQWFPRLSDFDKGILGAASKALERELMQEAIGFFRKRPELLEQLGPLSPGARRR